MPGDTYASVSGTSMATAMVTASFLLLKSALPGLEPWQYLEFIHITAGKKSLNKSYLFNDQYGNGVIRIDKAFEEGLKKFKGNRNFVESSESMNEWTFIERPDDEISMQKDQIHQTIVKEEENETLIFDAIKTIDRWVIAPMQNLTKLWS